MKKLGMLFSALMVFILLITSTGSALAANGTNSQPDPTATPLSGDLVITATIIDQNKLPGTELIDEMYLPMGFGGGMQFIGKGIQVSQAAYGEQRACFTFTGYGQGWTGSVYQWNGSKWLLRDTEITPGEDGSATRACSIIHGDGIYALLAMYTPLPTPKYTPTPSICGSLNWSIYMNIWTMDGGATIHITSLIISLGPDTIVPAGTNATFTASPTNMTGGPTYAVYPLNRFAGGTWSTDPYVMGFDSTGTGPWSITATASAMGCEFSRTFDANNW
jgi:hypothetical protein